MDEETPRFRAGVAAIVVLLHMVFYQLLGLGQGAAWVAPGEGSVMRVEFVVRTPPPAAAPAPLPARPRPAGRVAVPRESQARTARRARDTPPAPRMPVVEATGPGSEPLDLAWRPPATDVADFRQNLPQEPINFPTALEGPDRMALPRQVTADQVIEGAAKFLGLWPPGYESDPCPRVQRNIANLMTDTRPSGREALGEELRRQRIACRQ